MLVDTSGLIAGTIGGGHLEKLAIRDAKLCLGDRTGRTFSYPLCARTGQCCGGAVETFVDVLNAGPILYIFGAGHVGQALSRVMAETPFLVRLIDEREEWVGASVGVHNIPDPVGRIHAEPLSAVDQLIWDNQRTYAVVMTHSHELDYELIARLMSRPGRYLGLIGSRTKWDSFSNRLRQKAIMGTGEELNQIRRVRCPVGVDIGGKTPAEVAISIAAELVALHHKGYLIEKNTGESRVESSF